MPQSLIPTTYRTPDGVERRVSFSLGTQRRIIDRFKMQWQEVLKTYGDSALPELLYCGMYDANGAPPDIALSAMTEMVYSFEETREMSITFISAISNGKQTKKEIAERLDAAAASRETSSLMTMNGSVSGATPMSTSASPEAPPPAESTPAPSGS